MWYKFSFISFLTFFFSTISYANEFDSARIDNQNQQRQQQQEKFRQQQLSSSVDIKFDTPTTTLIFPKQESPCYPLKQITLVNYHKSKSSPISSAVINVVLEKFNLSLPHCFGSEGVAVLMKQIQNEIIDRGFVTTQVLAEPQDLTTGILKLTLVEGKVRHLLVEDSSQWLHFTRLSAWTALATSTGKILNIRDIEQSLENLKRIPTADANIEILPAEDEQAKVGESDLRIRYAQAFPIRMTLGLDDSGSKSTGKWQGSATLSFDNLLTANDLFYTSFTHSLSTKADEAGKRDTHNLSFHYSIPFKYWLLSLDHSQNQYHQEVFGGYQNYIYSGKSQNQKASLSYLLYRDNKRKTTLSTGVWARKSSSFIDDTEIEVQKRRTAGWMLNLSHREYLGTSTLDFELGFKRGTGAQGALAAPEELFNEGTSRSKIITSQISLNTPFSLGKQAFQYNFLFSGQWNKTPLTSQDRLSLGGRYTVRGFDGEVSLSGNRGWFLRNDLNWHAFANLQPYTGIDYGRVSEQKDGFSENQLMGAVVGAKGNVWGIYYDIFTGIPLKKPQGFKTSSQVVGFNLNYQF